jgi:prepilin-type N-terminal cleavage/methylation domain-containing protein
MSSRSFRPHRGFTLVELLIVITIIGMLMGLTVTAVWKAMESAKTAKIQVELKQLSEAMQGYKQNHVRHPPSMANLTNSAARLQAFIQHIGVAYPNILGAYKTASTLTPKIAAYTYLTPAGTSTNLNLFSLDAAEAMVFWLGGFPTPITVTGAIAGQKLFGFHRDSNDPFKRQLSDTNAANPLAFRTAIDSFTFDETRLVDNDKDGWLEYVALRPEGGFTKAPYVYFDSSSYGTIVGATAAADLLGYPRDDTGLVASSVSLLNDFGLAVPMALRFTGTIYQWANPNGFQVVCAGLDNRFAGSGSVTLSTPRIPLFPNRPTSTVVTATDIKNCTSGAVYAPGTGALLTGAPYFTEAEFDNLTNMSDKTLDATRLEAQK